MIIKFKKLNENATIPVRNGACYDLVTAEAVAIAAFNPTLIGLGFACKLPEGYHAEISMRSSTFKKYKLILANGIGVIDNAYCGEDDEWKLSVVLLVNPAFIDEHILQLPPGIRLAQFRLVKDHEDIDFEEVEHLEDKSRGGFGSTDSIK